MVFEILDHDLHGRVGRLKTKHGSITTPALAPVVNPKKSPFPIRDLESKFKCDVIITNAYLIYKYYGNEVVRKGIHDLLEFNHAIMTDSGAYQILSYGYIDLSPDYIIEYQKNIGSDIAVILDIPTAGASDKKYSAEWSVKETLRRAMRARLMNEFDTPILVAPLQGGLNLRLLSIAAYKLAELNYPMYALGSPTEIMKGYRFDLLVDMLAVARSFIPSSKPLHLFGAGHPMMLSLAVALGYDLFDSASYILYARDGRYMTSHGTIRINDLREFPCSCPICSSHDPSDLRELSHRERISLIAQHNLYVILEEIRRIREAIIEGTLMRLLEVRCRAHPYMFKAFSKLRRYIKLLERSDPLSKPQVRGLFLFDALSIAVNPKVLRFKKRVEERYITNRKYLLVFHEPETRPFHKDPIINIMLTELMKLDGFIKNFDVIFLSKAYGIVPLELCEIYPISQCEYGNIEWNEDLVDTITLEFLKFIKRRGYKQVIFVDSNKFPIKIKEKVQWGCKYLKIRFTEVTLMKLTDFIKELIASFKRK